MRILCLNSWGGTLGDALLSYLATAPADMLCLQEIIHSPASDKTWLTYRDSRRVLPQRANLFREIAEVLPDYLPLFCPATQGVLWDDDRHVPSQWGLASFVHRDFPVIGQVQSFVHKDYSAHGYGDHPRARSAHGIRLYDYAKDRPVSILQMHGLWDPRGKQDTPERAAQAQRLRDLADQLREPGDLSVICGDFNVEPQSETLDLLRAAGFTELVTQMGFAGTRTSHYKKPGRFADYMLINTPDAVRHFDVISDPEVSDHCPLLLEI